MSGRSAMSRLRRVAQRYGIAVLVFLVALGARMLLLPMSRLRIGYLLFYAALVVAAWSGGLGPGLLTTALSATAIVYFWIPPVYSFGIGEAGDQVTVVLFVGIGLLVSVLSERLRRATERSARNVARLDQEVRERVKAQATATSLLALTEKLRVSEERYRLLFERNLAAMFRSHRDGRMLDCNDAFVRLLGYGSRTELLGADAREFYRDPRDRDAVLASLDESSVVSNHDVEWRTRDGAPVSILLNIREVEDGCLEGTALDVTPRRRAQIAEREAAELRAVTSLANAAAHEINNPLTVVVGNLSLLERNGIVSQQTTAALKAARQIQEIVARMKRLTRLRMADAPSHWLPAMLDLRKSSVDADAPETSPTASGGHD